MKKPIISKKLGVFSKQESCQASRALGYQQCLMGDDKIVPLAGSADL